MESVLEDIKPLITPKHLMISIAAGITLQTMEQVRALHFILSVYLSNSHTNSQALPPESRVVRVMSNTPVLIRQGATVFALGQNANKLDGELVKKLFESVGICDQIPENLIDAVTALSGSGPAYVSDHWWNLFQTHH